MHACLLILFLFLSCTEVEKSSFYSETNKRWLAATGVQRINTNYESLDLVNTPKGTTQPLLKIKFLDSNFTKVSDCLFYKIPKNNDGVLFVVENPTNKECKALIAEKAYASISNIRNFGIDLDHKTVKLNIDTKSIEYNFSNYPRKRKNKLLENSKTNDYLVASSINYHQKIKIFQNGEICFDIDDDCNITKIDRCDSCKGGFFKTIASKCSSSFRKVCGVDSCGEKHKPACIRGVETSGMNMNAYCINDSPVGFCNKELRVVCENGVLICE